MTKLGCNFKLQISAVGFEVVSDLSLIRFDRWKSAILYPTHFWSEFHPASSKSHPLVGLTSILILLPGKMNP